MIALPVSPYDTVYDMGSCAYSGTTTVVEINLRAREAVVAETQPDQPEEKQQCLDPPFDILEFPLPAGVGPKAIRHSKDDVKNHPQQKPSTYG